MARERRRGDKILVEARTPGGRTESRTFPDTATGRRERDRWLREVEHSKDRGTYIAAKLGRMRLADWYLEWIKTKCDLRPTTHARLVSVVNTHVLPTFGRMQLSAIRNSAVRGWVADMIAKGYSASTVRKSYFALSEMLKAAAADRRIPHNPAEDVPLPAEPVGEQRFLTMDEVAVLASTIEPRYRAFVLLGAYGGLRFGELAGLRRKRVDLLRGSVTVAETLVEANGTLSFGPPKTKRSLRTVVVPRPVAKELEQHLEVYVDDSPDALVFTGPQGNSLYRGSFRRDVWLPAVRAVSLDGLRVHDLRHTFVSLWIAAGRNVKEVSVAAGHSSVAFTLDRYGHLYERDDEALQDELDAQLRGLSAVSTRTASVVELRPTAEKAR
jgi:integrase